TRQDHVFEVETNGCQRIVLEHLPKRRGLLLGLLHVDRGDELDLLHERQIRPVDTLRRVRVVWADKGVKSLFLMEPHVDQRVVGARHVRPMGGPGTKIGHLGTEYRV
ncbi:hypothetical protein H110_03291, partial [Trichophyton rubrum MR1448]